MNHRIVILFEVKELKKKFSSLKDKISFIYRIVPKRSFFANSNLANRFLFEIRCDSESAIHRLIRPSRNFSPGLKILDRKKGRKRKKRSTNKKVDWQYNRVELITVRQTIVERTKNVTKFKHRSFILKVFKYHKSRSS
jgi:hypothetical protein